LASAFNEWLPSVLQIVRPYFTPSDIEKGIRWNVDIANELQECQFGMFFLTPQNTNAPWLTFEAGALSKYIETAHVCPLLFDLETTDISGPLAQFQATKFKRQEVRKLTETVNSAAGGQAISMDVLRHSFEKFWPDLDKKVSSILHRSKAPKTGRIRSDRDLLEEMLQICRVTARRFRTRASDGVPISVMEKLVEAHNELQRHAAENTDDRLVLQALQKLGIALQDLRCRIDISSFKSEAILQEAYLKMMAEGDSFE
jgi:hypothetical protein